MKWRPVHALLSCYKIMQHETEAAINASVAENESNHLHGCKLFPSNRQSREAKDKAKGKEEKL